MWHSLLRVLLFSIFHTDDVRGTEFKVEFEVHRDVHVNEGNAVEVLMSLS